LIDAGVPFNERTVSGKTTLDTLIRRLCYNLDDQKNELSISGEALGVLEMLLDSGVYLNSLVAARHDWMWSYISSKAARYLLYNYAHGSYKVSEVLGLCL
jgi:hypothetical protein